jgi:hypothetical protein
MLARRFACRRWINARKQGSASDRALIFSEAGLLRASSPLAFPRHDQSGNHPVAHRFDRRRIPMKVRPDISPVLSAGFAYEPRLDIGKPDVIRPLVRADRDQ